MKPLPYWFAKKTVITGIILLVAAYFTFKADKTKEEHDETVQHLEAINHH
jgi:hypothetical protein